MVHHPRYHTPLSGSQVHAFPAFPGVLGAIVFLILTLSGCASKVHHESRSPWVSADDVDSLMEVLDGEMALHDRYLAAREARFDDLRLAFYEAEDTTPKFHALGRLMDEYMSYDCDSAMAICERRIVMADRSGNPMLITHSRLSLAHVYMVMGFFKEASAIIESYDSTTIPEYLTPYYYHIKRTLYGMMEDYSVRDSDKDRFHRLTDNYRDSLMDVQVEGTFYYNLILGDRLNSRGNYSAAARLLEDYLAMNPVGDHERAIAAYTLSESYRQMNDRANEKRQLIISAINDVRSGVREYVSLRKLALILYDEDDVKHAYNFLKVCMEDAKACNTRLRMIEINDIFPIVNDVYLDTIARQQSRMRWGLALLCLLTILLCAAIYFVYKQMRKARQARRNAAEINLRLRDANVQLTKANEQLKLANDVIAENSYLKEEYIARYMDQCTIYIEKLDKYRLTLNKIVKAGKVDDLKTFIRTLSDLDHEIDTFYDNFDITFLRLFPTFIDDFNRLLQPDQQIRPKVAGRLNTELRIFALIRLGINDSTKIAQFLRYSLATIYNYRTRVRNKAKGDRDNLEEEIMKIGRFS